MKQSKDQTIEQIKADVDRYRKEIEERQNLILALERYLPQESKRVEKPQGFQLSKAIKEVLKAHLNEWVFLDDMLKEIKTKWNYEPSKKSAQVTLNAWSNDPEQNIQKDNDKVGFYMLVQK